MKTLIQADEVVLHSPVDDKFPAAQFLPHIKRVERKTFRQELGNLFYQDLLQDRKANGQFTTPIYQHLWTEYLAEFLAYKVALAASIYANIKYTATGLQVQESEFTRAVSVKELGQYRKNLQTDITDIFTDLHEYLHGNSTTFKNYKGNLDVTYTKPKRRRIGGFVFPRSEGRNLPVTLKLPVSVLPNCFTFTQESLETDWVFSYEGELENEGIKVIEVLNIRGDDITSSIVEQMIDTELQTVLLVFETPIQGTVKIGNHQCQQNENIIKANIRLEFGNEEGQETSIIVTQIYEGAYDNFTVYRNDVLIGSQSEIGLHPDVHEVGDVIRVVVFRDGQQVKSFARTWTNSDFGFSDGTQLFTDGQNTFTA